MQRKARRTSGARGPDTRWRPLACLPGGISVRTALLASGPMIMLPMNPMAALGDPASAGLTKAWSPGSTGALQLLTFIGPARSPGAGNTRAKPHGAKAKRSAWDGKTLCETAGRCARQGNPIRFIATSVLARLGRAGTTDNSINHARQNRCHRAYELNTSRAPT
jgi:hypothetical protein